MGAGGVSGSCRAAHPGAPARAVPRVLCDRTRAAAPCTLRLRLHPCTLCTQPTLVQGIKFYNPQIQGGLGLRARARVVQAAATHAQGWLRRRLTRKGGSGWGCLSACWGGKAGVLKRCSPCPCPALTTSRKLGQRCASRPPTPPQTPASTTCARLSCAAGDTPESVELNGMKNLLAAVGSRLGGSGGRLLFSPDGRGAVQGWGRWAGPGRAGRDAGLGQVGWGRWAEPGRAGRGAGLGQVGWARQTGCRGRSAPSMQVLPCRLGAEPEGGGGSTPQAAPFQAFLALSGPATWPRAPCSLDDVVMGGISESGFVVRQGGGVVAALAHLAPCRHLLLPPRSPRASRVATCHTTGGNRNRPGPLPLWLQPPPEARPAML